MFPLFDPLIYLILNLINVTSELFGSCYFLSQLSLLHRHGHYILLIFLSLAKQRIVVTVKCPVALFFRILGHFKIFKRVAFVVLIFFVRHVVATIEISFFYLRFSALKLFFFLFWVRSIGSVR